MSETDTSTINKKTILSSLGDDFRPDWGLEVINAPKAWSKTKGKGVKIAVIDTGIDTNHPDLKDTIKETMDAINQVIHVTDEYGHGTHVAGLIAGKHTGVA